MIWKPHATVAAVIEQDGQYLLVEETPGHAGLKLNQPAGHLEAGESIIAACIREVLEETGHTFQPQRLIGVYHWTADNGTTFLRFAFSGNSIAFDPARMLDTEIVRAAWFGLAEIRARRVAHRSPLVMRCIEDYLAGKSYPLELLTYLD